MDGASGNHWGALGAKLQTVTSRHAATIHLVRTKLLLRARGGAEVVR